MAELRPIHMHFAKARLEGEHFGKFVIRAGYVTAAYDGREFHSVTNEDTQS